jgi:hypothetical protein
VGLAALTFALVAVIAPPPFAADTTLTGTVNGATVRLASGVSAAPVESLVRQLVKTYRAAAPGAVWFAQQERGLLWQRVGPPLRKEALRDAVRASKRLAKKIAERDAIFVGPVIFLFDTGCALGTALLGGCDSIGMRDLAAIAEAAVPLGDWHAVTLHERRPGETAWTWVAFEGVTLGRLFPAAERRAGEAQCRTAPYPLPAGMRCAVVASFAGDGPTGRFVSLRADGPAAAAREAIARGLVASGWREEGADFLSPAGRRLRLAASDGPREAELLLVETP